jgi:O-antigen/teichoic acid export membrane protein
MNKPQKISKALYLGKQVGITGSVQILVQLIGFLSGVLLIRYLPLKEYAFYTLANTFLGVMTILADSGVATGVLSEAGKVWRDKEKLGHVLATGIALRKRFALVSLLVSVPILFTLLLYNGASLLISLLICASIIPAFLAALSDNLLQIVPKLHNQILPLQQNQFWVSFYRLLATAIAAFLFPWAFAAVLAAGLPRIWGNFRLKSLTYLLVKKEEKVDPQVEKTIVQIVRRQMPMSIYFCLSSQISIWLISIFGNTTSLAQIGALNRISIITTIFSSIIDNLVLPKHAKLPAKRRPTALFFIKIFSAVVCTSAILLLLVYLFPKPILFVLGENYQNLSWELFLSMLGASIGLVSQTLYRLTRSRGWVMEPILPIILNVLLTIILIKLLDFSTLEGALWFKIGLTLFMFSRNFSFYLSRLFKLSN